MNNNKKATKRALLTSVMALVMCVVMLVGTTFAWFTDTASTAVNKIQAGNLDVALEMYDTVQSKWVSAEGKTLQFKKAADAPADEKVLWEPGCTYELPQLRVINKGNLALKYKVAITGIDGDAKLNEAIVWTIGDIGSTDTYTKLAVGGSKEFTISGKMKTDAGNEYQGLSIDGIGITVYATQDTVENDSFGSTYDADAGKDTAFYTLAEFNALTEIPAGIKNVYVNIDNTPLTGAGKCATVGNYNISDQYMWVSDGATAPDGYTATSRRNAQNNATAYRTSKDGLTVHVLGSLTAENYDNTNFSGFQALCFQLPEKSTVILENMTLSGSFNISGSYTYMYNLPDGSIGSASEGYTNVWYGFPFVIENIKLSNCTINGQWFANGNVAKNVEINGCTFNDYENKTANWANPIWWKNASGTNLTITNCNVTSTRPMKVGEGGIGSVSITNNIFTMLDGDKYTGVSSDRVKNTALCFGNKLTGNVEIKGNTVKGTPTALISLLDANMTMPEGKTFTVSGNILAEGVPTFVKWKDSASITPSFGH